MMIQRPAGRRDIRSASRTYGSRASAAVAAQRRALRMAARDTRLLGIPRMSQSYGGMRSGGELKGMDTTIFYNTVTSATNTNADITTLNLIQAGTGSWNRIGRKVTLKSVRVKGTVLVRHYLTALGDFSANVVRMIVVWDNQPAGGTEPLFNDIFGETSQAGAETVSYQSQPKYDTMSRFSVLKDWTYDSTPQNGLNAAGDVTATIHSVDCYVRLPNLETTFSGQSSPMTIADISTGALYIYFRAANGTAISVPSFTGSARLRYTD